MTDEKKATVRKLASRLKGMTEAQKIEFIAARGIVNVEGHTLSMNNTCLLLFQSNGTVPTVVGGYRQWQAAGRQVQAGQHGFIIWFPRFSKDEDADPELKGFLLATVFDVSQTVEI